MPVCGNRATPLVLLGVTEYASAEPIAMLLKREGMGLAFALGERACVRVAAAVSPDIILLDPRLPRPLLNLLRAHPLSKDAQVSWSQALAGITRTDVRDGHETRPAQEPVGDE